MRYIPFLLAFTLFAQSVDVSDSGASSGTTGSIGTVTINGQVYNQLSLRPEIPIGKLGVGLDVYLYFNDKGMYWDSWDFSGIGPAYRTIIDKIYYLRWGQPGDNLYIMAGALPSVTLGQGILVYNYANIMEYPQVRQIGLNLQAKVAGVGIELIHSNFKAATPGVLGFRGSYSVLPKLNIGASFVTDLNQLAGLPDSDGDGYPDYYDFYPTDETLHDSSDYWLDIYKEIMGNDTGFEDWYLGYNHHNPYVPNSTSDGISGIAFDVTYSLTENITLYSQFAKLIGEISDTTITNYLEKNDLGWGLVPLGTRAKVGPVNLLAEIRMGSRRFVFNYWDRAYDVSRVSVDGSGVMTRESQLYLYGKLTGFYAQAGMDVMNLLTLEAGYQRMQGETWDTTGDYVDGNNQTLLTTIGVNPALIPKVGKAEAFYQQSNVDNPFKFEPDASTIWGYNLGIEVSSGVMLVYQARTTYISDLNNPGEFEAVKSIQIETQFTF